MSMGLQSASLCWGGLPKPSRYGNLNTATNQGIYYTFSSFGGSGSLVGQTVSWKPLLIALARYLMGEGERNTLLLRKLLGWDGTEPKTLEEVGRAHDLTRERVRQIRQKFFVPHTTTGCSAARVRYCVEDYSGLSSLFGAAGA